LIIKKKKLNLKSESGLIFFLDFFGKILILGVAKIYIFMKQLLIAVLLWGTLFSCSKSEPCLSERGVSMQTFAYQDQLLHQKKFGLKIKHPGIRLEAVSTRLWFAGKLYFAKDFTWRYAMGETEGILHNGVNSSDMTYFRVEELKICISNRWYSLR